MLVTDLPTLRPDEYPAANCLRQEVRRAKDWVASFPNSGAAVTRFFSDLAGGSLPSTSAVVADQSTVTVKNSAGTVSKSGIATVANSAISGVALAATTAIVDNAATLPLQNSAGGLAGNVTATVAAGVVSNVKLPATSAAVTATTVVSSVTGTGTVARFVITAGVVSSVTLSAS